MTLVNRETGEILEISYADVRTSIDNAKSSLEEAANEIVWQVENRVWTHLGYADWNEMREAEYGGAAFMVPREDRPELQVRLKSAGLTNAVVAETMGVGVRTVERETAKWRDEHPGSVGGAVPNTRGQSRPTTYAKPDVKPADIAAAVAEFPELTHYADTGQERDVLRLAGALRGYDDDEREVRRAALQAHIAADKRGEATPERVVDKRAHSVFIAFNAAAQALTKAGGIDGVRAALTDSDSLELGLYRSQFADCARIATELAEACVPTIRRIK
jgi:hypothetical protein